MTRLGLGSFFNVDTEFFTHVDPSPLSLEPTARPPTSERVRERRVWDVLPRALKEPVGIDRLAELGAAILDRAADVMRAQLAHVCRRLRMVSADVLLPRHLLPRALYLRDRLQQTAKSTRQQSEKSGGWQG